MTGVAILGFGVVGGGVAALLTDNREQVKSLGGDDIKICRILDLREFPGSPFEKIVTHNFDDIINDSEVDTVIEVMGGSHPAYEYTVAALKSGKNVISSNKEVVANFGDEFLKLAKENGVSYRFEAAVGGGIPVLSPIISCVGQNKITEVRGILNGTTNYILTKMFTYGDSFEDSLSDAQERGYAERNPDADILGTDAARKIVILTALVTGKLISPNDISVEGITKIRKEDVLAAEKIGAGIKLLGRCVINGDDVKVMVAPFMIPKSEALATISGVYNAVEVIGEPIGNVMFYGQGAGAGATASAVVGDLMQIMRSGIHTATPVFEKCEYCKCALDSFESQNYFAVSGISESDVRNIFGNIQLIGDGEELTFISEKMSEQKAASLISSLSSRGAALNSRIRLL